MVNQFNGSFRRYGKVIALLASSSFASSCISLVSAPILGRLYEPAEYGELTEFTVLATGLSTISTLGLPTTIIMEENDASRRSIAVACLYCVVIVGCIGGGLLWATVAGVKFLLFLPVVCSLAGVTTISSAFLNRNQQYRSLALSSIVSSFSTASLSVIFGAFDFGVYGLFYAYLFGQVILAFTMFRTLQNSLSISDFIAIHKLIPSILPYKGFIFYTLPSAFVQNLTVNSVAYALSFAGQDASLGAFSRAVQILALPLNPIMNAVSQVFQRDAVELLQNGKSCRPLFVRTLSFLIVMPFFPSIVILLFAPLIFSVILGPKWLEAGEIARILLPMYFLQCLCNPLANMFFVRKKNHLAFIISMFTALITFLIVFSVGKYTENTRMIVIAYSLAGCLSYLVFLFYAYRLASSSSCENVDIPKTDI